MTLISEIRRIATPGVKEALRHVLPLLPDDRRLTAASMAADGDTCAFAQALDPGYRLALVSVDQLWPLKLLVETASPTACISGLAIRPDGMQLVFVEWQPGAQSRLFLLDFDPSQTWRGQGMEPRELLTRADHPRHLRWYNNRYFYFSDARSQATWVYDCANDELVNPRDHGLAI